DAPVVHLEDLFLGRDDEVLIDADLAELVLDDRDALAVLCGEDVVEERGFAGPEKPGQHGDRDAIAISTHRATPHEIAVSRSWRLLSFSPKGWDLSAQGRAKRRPGSPATTPVQPEGLRDRARLCQPFGLECNSVTNPGRCPGLRDPSPSG